MKAASQKRSLDMLHGTLWDKIPRFAVPVAATAILSQLFNAADIAVIGNFTGELRTVAVAAVGTNSSIISLIVNLFIGIALGANVTIAHAIGEKNDTMVHRAVHTSIVVAVLGGLIAAVIGELFAVPLLNQLNVPDDVFPLALLYLRIYLAGLPVILLYNFEAAVFRSVGETKIPLIALTASGVLNVILNLFFVAALHDERGRRRDRNGAVERGQRGDLVGFLLKTDKVICLEPKKLRIDGLCLKQILRIGVPAGVQSAMFSIANIVIQGAINSLGTVVMAASSAAYNIEIITYDILNSFSQACTTFVGQNFGAGEIKRCKKTLLLCLLEGIISLGVAIALILFFGKSLLTIFNGDPQVVETGYIRLMLIMPSHLFSLCYEVLSGYLRGFEISLPPAVLTMLGVCGVRLSWLRWVFPQYKTFMNIMLVFPISLATTALLMLAAVLYFRPSRRYAHLQKSDGAASAKIEG
ncbi:MAG: MATE family efflux transporter [Oscillibacter sp.]